MLRNRLEGTYKPSLAALDPLAQKPGRSFGSVNGFNDTKTKLSHTLDS